MPARLLYLALAAEVSKTVVTAVPDEGHATIADLLKQHGTV